ncbi:hypothetical protein [Candidatus Electronema sp. PJ]|uniref:hypothetical protein n=1 Tax=Candidatus Electronema sp. PJ TaxID=3401572 RepID=UPI003AA9CCF1
MFLEDFILDCLQNSALRFLFCSLAKQFGWASEECCRLRKELYSAAEKFGLAKLLSC